jgi:hypothetical protein
VVDRVEARLDITVQHPVVAAAEVGKLSKVLFQLVVVWPSTRCPSALRRGV